jgi:hypothetical protein
MLVPTVVDDDPEVFSSLASGGVPTPDALARAVRQRRVVELRMSQEDVREASGLSITTIGKIEQGGPDLRVQRSTMRRLDLALQWPVGTCESWYDGRAGVVAGVAPPNVAGLVEELAPLVAAQLRGDRQLSVISVADVPAEVVAALEQLVVAIRAVVVHRP